MRRGVAKLLVPAAVPSKAPKEGDKKESLPKAASVGAGEDMDCVLLGVASTKTLSKVASWFTGARGVSEGEFSVKPAASEAIRGSTCMLGGSVVEGPLGEYAAWPVACNGFTRGDSAN